MTTEHNNNNGGGTMIHRDEFGATEIATTAERQSGAIQARVTAEIQARSIVALQRPRDLMRARERLLQAARRPRFAEVARYRKPVGKKKNEETGKWEDAFAVGPSIRFIEEAMRCFGNVSTDSMITEDASLSRTVRVTATDLEANLTHAADITFDKTVERRKVNPGQRVLRQRTNSYGDAVYVIEATDDEAATKQAALMSKAVRTLGQRLIPGDLVEEAIDMCIATLTAADKADPAAALKRLADAFAAIGVRAEHLAEYLGHPLDQATLEERDELRAIGTGIKDGDTTWREMMELKKSERTDRSNGDGSKPDETPAASKIDQLKAKLAQKQQASKEPAKPETAQATATATTTQPAQAATLPVADPKQADPPAQAQPTTEAVNTDAEDPGPPDDVAEQLALKAEKRTPAKEAPLARKVTTVDFVKSGDAWADHLAGLDTAHKVSVEWNEKSSAFKRAGCYDSRRATALERVRALVLTADEAEHWLSGKK